MRVCACVCVCMCVCMYMFVYLYTCVLGGMWVPQVPQDAAEFAMVWLAGEGAGRGLLSYGLLSYGVQSVSGKGIWSNVIKRNIFIFSPFLNFKINFKKGFRADLDISLIVQGFPFLLLQGEGNHHYKGWLFDRVNGSISSLDLGVQAAASHSVNELLTCTESSHQFSQKINGFCLILPGIHAVSWWGGSFNIVPFHQPRRHQF